MWSAWPKNGWPGFAVGGGDPAGVGRVLVEFCVAEVFAGEEAELPEVIGDVFADVGDGAVGADDDFGVFVGGVSSLLRMSSVPARRMTQQPLFLPSVSR